MWRLITMSACLTLAGCVGIRPIYMDTGATRYNDDTHDVSINVTWEFR